MSIDIFKQTFDLSPVGIGIVNNERKIIYANKAYYDLHGYTPKEMADQDVINFIDPADLPIQQQVEKQLFSGKSDHYRMEVRIRCKDNSSAWALIQGYIKRKTDGNIDYSVGFFTDITEKKRQEQELFVKSQALGSAADAVAMGDLAGNISYVNEAFLQMWGYEKAGDVIGKSFLILSSDEKESMQNLHTVLRQGNLATERMARRRDGTPFFIKISASVVKDSAGNPVCIIVILEDITQRKNYEEELLMKSHALASSKSGVFITNTSGKVVYINKAMLEMSGYASEADMLDKHISQFRTPAEEVNAIQEQMRKTGYWKGERQILNKNGQPRDLELFSSLVMNRQGESLGSMTWITDITERKQIGKNILDLNRSLEEKNHELLTQEEELRAANEELTATVNELHETQKELKQTLQDLQHKNFELDQFVYKTSHDLRAPLTTILGLVELLKKEPDEATKSNYILLVENRIQRLDNFIKSMLDYSRNARSQVIREPVIVTKLIDECLHELEYMKNFSRLHISVEAPAEETIYTDAFRLKIILNNIISNAIKYQNESIPDSKLLIRVNVQPDQTQIQFADNGIGIKQEYMDKIFNMFFRATENAEGSGLGLYIVKQAIQALQGTISLKSEPGVGTETTITIPNR